MCCNLTSCLVISKTVGESAFVIRQVQPNCVRIRQVNL